MRLVRALKALFDRLAVDLRNHTLDARARTISVRYGLSFVQAKTALLAGMSEEQIVVAIRQGEYP